MEFHAAERANRIDFSLEGGALDILDQVAFIVLVSLKFSGDVSGIDTFTSGVGTRMWAVTLQFENYDSWDSARAHCYGHLDAQGRVNASYRGALPRADPGLRQAEALLLRLRALR
jgi:hypothetical protein